MASRNVLLGFIAGAAVGALAGVLFAPDKGSKTRQKLSERGQDYMKKSREKFDEMKGAVSEQADGIREKAKDFVRKGKDAVENAKPKTEEERLQDKPDRGFTAGQKYAG